MTGPVLEMPRQRLVVAEPRGAQVEHALGVVVFVPELLAPFDSLVQLFHPGLNRTTGDRQPFATVTRVVHAPPVVVQIAPLAVQHAPRMLRFVGGPRRWCQPASLLLQFPEDLLDPTLPA